MTSCRASVVPPGDRCTHVHPAPGTSSVTSHTSFGIRGCLISNRLPTARPGPSSATSRVTEAVHSGQRSTSLKTSHTTAAGASISTPLSVIMYQMVHRTRLVEKPRRYELHMFHDVMVSAGGRLAGLKSVPIV